MLQPTIGRHVSSSSQIMRVGFIDELLPSDMSERFALHIKYYPATESEEAAVRE